MKFKINTSQVQQLIDVVQDDPYKYVVNVISLLTTLEKENNQQESNSKDAVFYITQEQVNAVRTYLQEKPFKIVFNCINLLSKLETVPDESQVSSS